MMTVSGKVTQLHPHHADDGIRSLFADANRCNLHELGCMAMDRFAVVNATIEKALIGKSVESRDALAVGYLFAVRCMEDPAGAATLPGWEDVALQVGSNPWYRPLKWACRDATEFDASKLSMIAAVFRDAHQRGVNPAEFAEVLKREGYLRRWYRSIPKQANRVRGALAKTMPGRLAPNGRATSVLIAWDPDKLDAVLDSLEVMPGFIGLLDLTPDQVAKIIEQEQ